MLTSPLVVPPGQGTVLNIADALLVIKATGDQTGGAWSLVEGVWQPGGFGPLPHIHKAEEESFYVLEGAFDFRLADETLRAEAGTFVLVPRGVLHAFAVAGDQPSRLMFLHSPALDGFFLELAGLAQAGRPEPDAVRELMGKWGMEARRG